MNTPTIPDMLRAVSSPRRARPIFFPQGPVPDSESAAACVEMMHRSGGDLQRLFDGPSTDVESFINHVSRLPVVKNGNERPFVVLTDTENPTATVSDVRGVIERAVPQLAAACWVIYVTAADRQRFISVAATAGSFDDELSPAPMWTTHDMRRYLVLSDEITDTQSLLNRVHEVETRSQPAGTISTLRPRAPAETKPPVRRATSRPTPAV